MFGFLPAVVGAAALATATPIVAYPYVRACVPAARAIMAVLTPAFLSFPMRFLTFLKASTLPRRILVHLREPAVVAVPRSLAERTGLSFPLTLAFDMEAASVGVDAVTTDFFVDISSLSTS